MPSTRESRTFTHVNPSLSTLSKPIGRSLDGATCTSPFLNCVAALRRRDSSGMPSSSQVFPLFHGTLPLRILPPSVPLLTPNLAFALPICASVSGVP